MGSARFNRSGVIKAGFLVIPLGQGVTTCKSQTVKGDANVLALTEEATTTIEEILAEPGIPDGSGVRIATAISTMDPTSNAADATGLQVGLAATPDDNDEVIEERGARVFVEDTAAMLLDDKVLDADRSGEQVRFSIANQGEQQ